MENVIHNNNEINETPNLVSQTSNMDSSTATPKLTEFEDSKPYISSGTQPISAHPSLGTPEADIKTFLSRPVKVYSGLSTATGFLINPLKLFLSNPTVAAKTANYLAIRATVCVRYSESAMPFVYGCRQIAAIPYMDTLGDLRYIHPQHYSHLQCHYTNPTVGNPILFKLPYISTRPYDNIRDIKNTWNTWNISVQNIVTYARSDVNTPPTNTCSIHVWLEDVELAIPLATDVTWQSEYKGVISVPATAIAKAANVLSSVPAFAPFTTPVEHASTLVAKLAANLGFSRPNQLEPPAVFVDNADHNMAVSTYLDVAQKLTTDPKQGLNVDSYNIDGNTEDPLAFANFHSKECYLGSINWTTSNTVGAFLETIPVTPSAITHFGANGYGLPASSIPGLGFKLWHGSMKFRFKVVCSAFHRGRIRIYWSPTLLSFGPTEIYNELESTLIDVETNKETVVTVNWAQCDYWKQLVYQKWNAGGANNWNYANGFLYVRVSQELNAPLSTADAKILVFVSGGDDLEYAQRSNQNISTFHLMARSTGTIPMRVDQPLSFDPNIGTVPTDTQWQSMTPDKEAVHTHVFNKPVNMSNATLSTTGERITSFRELTKTWNLWEAGWLNKTANTATLQYVSFPSFPMIPGGFQWHSPQPSIGFRLYDSPMTLMASIFGGYKGGIRWKIIFDSDIPTNAQISVCLVREPISNAGTNIAGTYSLSALTGGNPNPIYAYHNNGIAVSRSGNSITFEIPYQRARLFLSMPNASPIGQGYGGGTNNAVVSIYYPGNGPTDKIPYRAYMCAAEDTTFVLYRGMGMSYAYNVFTTIAAARSGGGDDTTTNSDETLDLPPLEAISGDTL